MPSAFRLLPVAVAALVAAACATKANVDYDPNARFDHYQTYAWLAPEDGMREVSSREADPLLLRRIRTTIDEGLAAKGYRKLDSREAADFVVNFTVGSREKLRQTSSATVGIGSYGRYGGWGMSAPVTTESYTEGTLAIDVFDGESKEAVWHGRASRRVTPSMDRAELVNDVVGAILKKFPPER